jgi:hypothetical protein
MVARSSGENAHLSSPYIKSLMSSKRDFVSHVQQQLMALGPGESRLDIVVLEPKMANKRCDR